MNERIKTLCQEAFTEAHESRIGPNGLVRSDGNPYIFYEKFAELIVRECMNVLDPGEHQLIARFQARKWLAEHFGVAE